VPTGTVGSGNRGNPAGGGSPAGKVGGGTKVGGGLIPKGPVVVRTHDGGEVWRGHDGGIREVHTPNGAVIHHAPGGAPSRVEMVRPGGRVVVATSHGRGGYVQRPLVHGGHTYVQRTYIDRGVRRVHVYRPYIARGISFNVYTPVRHYPAGFYTWADRPWGRPVPYRWSSSGSPWRSYYDGYFTPDPAYTSPAAWLTDFLVSNVLDAAFQNRPAAEAAAAPQCQAPMTPDVKQAIGEEVRRQLEQERMERQNPNAAYTPAVLNGGARTFLVSNAMEVNTAAGQACWITEGDVLRMNGSLPQDAMAANVMVASSKSGQDCPRDAVVTVGLADLQEMQNNMQATLDQGIQEIQSKQGQGGLPAMPASASGPAVDVIDVAPDANVETEISSLSQEANRAEEDMVSQAQGGGSGVSVGDTIDDVVARFGQPDQTVDLGSKKIFVYRNLKITFTDGRVTDAQ